MIIAQKIFKRDEINFLGINNISCKADFCKPASLWTGEGERGGKAGQEEAAMKLF